jgi:hypothetical protein
LIIKIKKSPVTHKRAAAAAAGTGRKAQTVPVRHPLDRNAKRRGKGSKRRRRRKRRVYTIPTFFLVFWVLLK